jgi:hypothetical protein
MGCFIERAKKTIKKRVEKAMRKDWLMGARMAKGTLKRLSKR